MGKWVVNIVVKVSTRPPKARLYGQSSIRRASGKRSPSREHLAKWSRRARCTWRTPLSCQHQVVTLAEAFRKHLSLFRDGISFIENRKLMGYGRRQQMQNDRCGRWSRSSYVLQIGAGIKTRKVYRSGVARDFNCCELRQRILPHSSSQEVSFRRSFFVQFHLLVLKSSALMTCQNSGESLFHGWGLAHQCTCL